MQAPQRSAQPELMHQTSKGESSVTSRSTRWINVLLKGEQQQPDSGSGSGSGKHDQDEYVQEFSSRSLEATVIPILEFSYKNLDQLKRLLVIEQDQEDVGLILTSPRAVESVSLAFKADNRLASSAGIAQELVFVVGPKTARECNTRLPVKCNIESLGTGNSVELAKMIERNLSSLGSTSKTTRLIYPKSSLADRTIEQHLEGCNSMNVQVDSLVTYETRPLDDMLTPLVEGIECHLGKMMNRNSRPSELNVNLIFFSPSGVEGFVRLGPRHLESSLTAKFTDPTRGVGKLTLRYSCIGKTTELALRKNNLEVFCVASKPNARALAQEILVRCQA